MDDFLKVAKEAAEKAGELLKKRIKGVKILQKKDGAVDLLTSTDLAAQKLIIDIINDNFPNHGILSEEMKERLNIREKEYVWVIDPIDGTSAYSVGLPTYSSSIALLRNKKPIIGAIYVAILDEVIYGMKGQGVFSNKKRERLKVRSVSNLQDAAIGFDPGYHQREKYIKAIVAPLADKVRIVPMIWSQATALTLIARGILDGYIQCASPKVWDAAAGKLIVEEAGGIITDFKGRPVDIFNLNGYVAGTPAVHTQLLSFTHH